MPNSTDYTNGSINSTSYNQDPPSLSGIIMEDSTALMDDSTYTMDDAKTNTLVANSTSWTVVSILALFLIGGLFHG